MRRIGIDVGSTYTKYCIIDAGGQMQLQTERTPVRQREYFAAKLPALRAAYGDCPVMTCGYGRKNIAYDRTVTELTALAAGAERQCPEADGVLDIGGQDTKLVCQRGGKLNAFFVNDRCAAGCGLFLGNVLHLLEMDFDALDLTGCDLPAVRLSSVCAVFAQSEIVELIAAGADNREIVHGVVAQILMQSRALLGKADCGLLALSGGLTRITGIGPFAEKILQRPVVVPEHGAYLSAIGCAVLAGGTEEQGHV